MGADNAQYLDIDYADYFAFDVEDIDKAQSFYEDLQQHFKNDIYVDDVRIAIAIAGGVASNSALRNAMKEACEKRGIKRYYPSPIYCTDNAAMIGVAGYYEYIKGTRHGWDLNAAHNLKHGER